MAPPHARAAKLDPRELQLCLCRIARGRLRNFGRAESQQQQRISSTLLAINAAIAMTNTCAPTPFIRKPGGATVARGSARHLLATAAD